MPDLFYSFGSRHPGALTLHNYPRYLQNLTRDSGERLDLAAVDILRDRERGVPRYNEFRRLLRKPPAKSFDELTRRGMAEAAQVGLQQRSRGGGPDDRPLCRAAAAGVRVQRDRLPGVPRDGGRRLKSDRFFTDYWKPEIYTERGLDWVRKNSMLTVLKRHHPHLLPALEGVTNAFHPWKKVTGQNPPA